MLIFGNKYKIAFEVHKMEEQVVVMNVIVNSLNISYKDNSYYVFALILNIKKEIDFISGNDLSINSNLVNMPLSELYNIFYNSEIDVYKNSKDRIDMLFYDLSAKKSLFYVYQKNDLLVFFGKFYQSDTLITSTIEKFEFLEMLSNLLDAVKPIAVPWSS